MAPPDTLPARPPASRLTARRRAAGLVGVLLGNLLSAGLAVVPFTLLALAALEVRARTVGAPHRVLDSDEPVVLMVAAGLALLAVALAPALVADALVGRWTGWARRTRLLVAAPLVAAPAVASVLDPDVLPFLTDLLRG